MQAMHLSLDVFYQMIILLTLKDNRQCMKTATRVVLTFLTFVAGYFFVYWVPLSHIPGMHQIPLLHALISFFIAVALCIWVWKQTATTSHSFAYNIIMGGIIFGAIGFILGFFGPIIFTPQSPQGPLLGIFITGPLCFILGLIAGALYWKFKVKNI